MVPLLVVAFLSLTFGIAMTATAGALAKRPAPAPAFSRKVFHVGIFTGAVPAQMVQGFWGVVTYGAVIGSMVLLASWKGSGASLHDALVRNGEGEGPRSGILGPLASTAFGGLLAVTLVGTFAVVGYLVCGWGDAAGELAGRRWGRHRYRIPFSRRKESTRSLEGSLAVFVTSAVAGWAGLALLGHGLLPALGAGVLCGVVGALAEGLSSSGTDNFWLQLLPALTAWWLVG